MRKFAIYSPVLGLRKDWPSVLLDKSFVPDLQNAQFWNGEIRTAKMRRKQFLRQHYACSPYDVIIYVDGDITTNIPTGSDIVLFNAANGYYETHENVTVSYNAGTEKTEITPDTGDTFTYPVPAPGGIAPGPRVALYTAGMEVDPSETAFLHVPVPDGEAITHFHDLLTDSNDLYCFAFTAKHAYLWSTVLTSWIAVHTPASDVSHWSTASLNGNLVVTNNVDVPLVWNGTLTVDSFEGLGGTGPNLGPEIASGGARITKAKFVTAFEGHIILANYELSTSDAYPNGIIWSDLDDHTNFIPATGNNDAGAAYVEGEGVISGGFGRKGDLLYVFKDRSMRVYWYTGDSLIFNSRPYNVAVGTVSPDSVVNDADGRLFFYASDMTFREVDLGDASRPLGDDVRNFVQDTTLINKIRATFVREYGEVWWAVPYGSSATGNNRVYCLKNGVWYFRDLAVSAFGQYRENSNFTWDTLPFSTWDAWDWPAWDSVAGVAGWPLDLCAGYDNKCYLSHGAYTDDGAAYTSYFVLSTDLGDGSLLQWYKRLLAIRLFLQRVGTEAFTVYVRRDNETAWQTAGTINPTDQNEVLVERLPVDYRARRFEIKVTSTTPFRFLGMEFDFNISGER